MTKWEAISSFWSGFSIPAYDENSVPKEAVLPYITYSCVTGAFEDPVPMSASIWYRDMDWQAISEKEMEIKEAIGISTVFSLDNREYIHLYPGSPFSQRMGDEDPGVRRIYMNITCEFFTS